MFKSFSSLKKRYSAIKINPQVVSTKISFAKEMKPIAVCFSLYFSTNEYKILSFPFFFFLLLLFCSLCPTFTSKYCISLLMFLSCLFHPNFHVLFFHLCFNQHKKQSLYLPNFSSLVPANFYIFCESLCVSVCVGHLPFLHPRANNDSIKPVQLVFVLNNWKLKKNTNFTDRVIYYAKFIKWTFKIYLQRLKKFICHDSYNKNLICI